MSNLANKFLAGASTLLLASSVFYTPTTNAQAVGTITGGAGGNLVFCGTAGTTASVVDGVSTAAGASQNLGSSATFSAGGTVRVAYNSRTAGNSLQRGLDDNNRCIDASAAELTFTPRIDFSRHTTRFQVRLNNDGSIELTQVDVSNSAPTVNTNMVCIAPNGRARFAITDAEGDTVTTLVSSPSNGSVQSGSTYIDYTPNSDFVGTETLSVELQDNVMSAMASNVALSSAVPGQFTAFVGSVLPNVSSGTNPVKQTLTVQVSSTCAASSMGMSSSTANSSMMSSSAMSSSVNSSVANSSAVSSSVASMAPVASSSSVAQVWMPSSEKVVYVEIISAKGGLIRTGGESSFVNSK